MKPRKDMKSYRVNKIISMSEFVSVHEHIFVYDIILETDSDRVTLEFRSAGAIGDFRDRFLDTTDEFPDAEKDVDFIKKLAATPFDEMLIALSSKDNNLLRRALWRLTELGKKAFLDAVK